MRPVREPGLWHAIRKSNGGEIGRYRRFVAQAESNSAQRAGFAAPGGLLVYSTCSLEREENEDVAAEAANAGARLLSTMHRLPGREPSDGYFAAVLSHSAG